MAAQRHGAHLFVGDMLNGRRWTERATPAAFYEVDGEIFDKPARRSANKTDRSASTFSSNPDDGLPVDDEGMSGSKVKTERWRKYWDRHSKSYDREMAFFDRRLFGDSRDWVCGQAVGDVLEVAIGTGLNLAHYPPEVRVTGIEFSPAMLDLARERASSLPREIDLREGDAQQLD